MQIHHVISDITGSTGRATVDAILAGQRDGAELAKLRDPRIQADTETMRKSLKGNWWPVHLFTLGQSRDLYHIYQQQIVNCDLEIEAPRIDPGERPLPPDRKRNRAGGKRRRKNGHPHPEFDLRTEAYKLFGVDVSQIPGLEENALPCSVRPAATCRDGPAQHTLFPGLHSVRTTTSAAGSCLRHGPEAGNGGHSQGRITAPRDLLYSERRDFSSPKADNTAR